MKRLFCFSGFLFSALFLCLPVQASAGDDTGLKTSITEAGECGHENVGKLQFLNNSDQDNGYVVTLKAMVTHQGEIKESLETQDIEAGDKKVLGCSFSDIMPLTTYKWSIISEAKK